MEAVFLALKLKAALGLLPLSMHRSFCVQRELETTRYFLGLKLFESFDPNMTDTFANKGLDCLPVYKEKLRQIIID